MSEWLYNVCLHVGGFKYLSEVGGMQVISETLVSIIADYTVEFSLPC